MTTTDARREPTLGARTETAWIVGLFAFFLTIVAWFVWVDFYNRHFFDHGAVVFADNLARIGFLFLLAWLIYAPGAAIARWLQARMSPVKLSPLERAVIGFGIGVGLWHVLMLLLGLAGLYYRSVMIGLAGVVLLCTARHFAAVASASWRSLTQHARDVAKGIGIRQTLAVVFVVACAIALLLVRGLYPGGGGDYYTHYFYYYLEVLKNHDLSPNDVWYHYYYSKGYGLFFLAMLLTDPEAPSLVTFCCVVFAAAAMAGLAQRLAPGTLWPACVASLFLLHNLISDARGRASGAGHFQKDHEQVSALIVLVVVGLCMAQRPTGRRVWLTMATLSAIAIAIIAQPMGVIVGGLFVVIAGIAMLRRRWLEMRLYVLSAAVIGATVGAIMVIGYLATGLAHDQALDLTLRFADMERLDRWGVLPQLVIVAWIRDNYLVEAAPWASMIMNTLPTFMRIDQLWTFLLGAIVLLPLLIWRAVRIARTESGTTAPQDDTISIGATLGLVALLIAVLAVVSAVAGRAQPVSFERATTFFVPLLLLLGVAFCGWCVGRSPHWERRLIGALLPAVLLVGTVALWNHNDEWMRRATTAVENGARLFAGTFSLADAYAHLDAGLPFGGINPQALAAWRSVEPGATIWATNVDGYCMAPGCWVGSVVSFKMSGKLDEIVTASPERAKQLLQEVGLNYFLIAKDSLLLDLLPYSNLFAPDTIGRYLGIKWTDGSAFLLTWSGPQTTPLTPEFYKVYQALLDRPENPWFRFSRLVKDHIGPATAALRAKRWGAPVEFAWRAPPPDGTIDIVEATYGGSCQGYKPKFPAFNYVARGNANGPLRDACSGQTQCRLRWEIARTGDPASGCEKDLSVSYRCGPNTPIKLAALPPEANGHEINLDCPTQH